VRRRAARVVTKDGYEAVQLGHRRRARREARESGDTRPPREGPEFPRRGSVASCDRRGLVLQAGRKKKKLVEIFDGIGKST